MNLARVIPKKVANLNHARHRNDSEYLKINMATANSYTDSRGEKADKLNNNKINNRYSEEIGDQSFNQLYNQLRDNESTGPTQLNDNY